MAEVAMRIIQDNDLSTSEKLVYLYIAANYRSHYRNPFDYENYDRVGADIGLCSATVRKAMRRLEDVELIKVVSPPPHLTIHLQHLDSGYSLLRQLASAGGR